eukprot:gb/GECG01004103.1/.p1 GENE.gb/GECG01004103.1/~~gb/GECG01004103.1/.p1  ORF type:complete len:305 (+),score=11.97 gb/GECG01004103.1/:1-915(+)
MASPYLREVVSCLAALIICLVVSRNAQIKKTEKLQAKNNNLGTSQSNLTDFRKDKSEIEKRLTINLFTNCVAACPRTTMIHYVLDNFRGFFALHNVTVQIFADPRPKWSSFPTFARRLARLGTVVQTRGLADGYTRSIKATSTEYALQLEHDWLINANTVNHSMYSILMGMKQLRIDYLRFDRHNTWSRCTSELHAPNLTVCVATDRWKRSNGPHIIHVPSYVRYLKLIGGSVESHLGRKLTFGYIYGPIGYPSTLCHLDGRHLRMYDNHSVSLEGATPGKKLFPGETTRCMLTSALSGAVGSY